MEKPADRWISSRDEISKFADQLARHRPDNLLFHSSVGTETQLVLLFFGQFAQIFGQLSAFRLSSGSLATLVMIDLPTKK